MPTLHSPSQNELLAGLPEADLARLAIHLERVPMRLGDVLFAPDVQLELAYFPTTAVVSFVAEENQVRHVALIGKEGMVGIPLLLAPRPRACRATVEMAGEGYCLSTRELYYELNRSGPMLRLALHYAEQLNAQLRQQSKAR